MNRTERALFHLKQGFFASQLISVAARLRLADAVGDEAVPCAELARRLGTDERALVRLVRALVVVGIVRSPSGDDVALTDLGQALRAGEDDFMARAATISDFTWRSWGSLFETVMSGTPAFESDHGREVYDHLAAEPAVYADWNRGVAEGTAREAGAIVATFAFDRYRTVVDVGGGLGGLLAAVLDAHDIVAGVLFEHEQVVGEAATGPLADHVGHRATLVAGDFFAGVATGDLMLLKSVLLDWDDDRAATILRRCREALAPGGAIVVVDRVLPDSLDELRAASINVMVDVNLMVHQPGRVRTGDEYRRLFAAAGLELIASEVVADTPFHLMELRPR